MIFDAIIGATIIFSMVFAYRNGLLNTLIHTFGWLLSLTIGFAFFNIFKNFLYNTTSLHEAILLLLNNKFNEFTEEQLETISAFPPVLYDLISNFSYGITNSLSERMALIFFSLISFFILVILTRILLLIILRIFSKKHATGVVGFIDGFLGMLVGFLRGVLISFIILALLIPISGILDIETTTFICDSLENATFSKVLYDNNFILLVISDIFK